VSATRQALFWLAAFAAFFLLLHLLGGMLLPFVAGLGIAYILAPLVELLTRWRLPRGLAALVGLLLFILVLVVVIVLIVPVIELQTAQLVRSGPAIVEFGRQQIQNMLDLAQEKLPPEDVTKIRDMVGGWTGTALGFAAGFAQRILSGGLAIANILSLLLITPMVAFFMLRDWDLIVARIDSWLPRHYAPTIREQWHLVDETIAGYIHGQAIVSLITGVYYAIALAIVGLNFAVVIGIVIGILSFIPYIGEAIGLLMAFGLAGVQFGSWSKIGVIAIIFAVGHTIAGNYLQPKLVGSRVHLHPVWVIFALLAFGALFGFVGVLVALPAAAVTGVLVRFAISRYLASSFYDPDQVKREGPS